MKNQLYPENRIKPIETIRKALKKAFSEDFIQENVSVDNGSLIVRFRSKSYLITIDIDTS